MNVGPIAFLPGAGSGAEALERLAAGTFDLVALHLNLPDGDGFAVGRKIRARSVMPIMMVTGKGDTIDRVVGLERGADDDTAKPFQLREVAARGRAILRRTTPAARRVAAASAPGKDAAFVFEGWVLDVPKRELRSTAGTPASSTCSSCSRPTPTQCYRATRSWTCCAGAIGRRRTAASTIW
jgi:DNA-binding response OmpR family regulator